MSKRGLFIVIEGGDGAGKSTQANKLAEKLTDAGKKVIRVKFPQYGKPSAVYIERYLNGEYGSADQVPADLASLAYAINRFDACAQICQDLDDPDTVLLADRYVASNLAHQGTKFGTSARRKEFYDQNMELEYGILGIPRADLNVVLLVPSDVAQLNMQHESREKRYYTDQTLDIHESDYSHLERAKANYEELCGLYPNEFKAVECTDSKFKMRPISEIQQDIWKLVEPLIAG